MKEKVLEIEIIKVNEDWSTWYISYQNEKVLPRWEFKDDELSVYSVNYPMLTKVNERLYILGTHENKDLIPCIISKADIPLLREKVDQINEKYGIEKFEIERCMKEEMYYVINSDFSVTWDIEGGKLINELRYVSLNYFKLKTEAKWCASKMKDYLLELRKEWREKNEKN